MATYKAPLKDLNFIANEVLEFPKIAETINHSDATPDLMAAIFEEAGKLASEVFHPLNRIGDLQGCRLEDGNVITPEGFKAAFQQYVDGGWGGISSEEEYGGQGMPHMISFMLQEIFNSTNHSLYMYPGLTHGAYGALSVWGTEEQKKKFMPKMCNCEWTGTMNLTEPHCGTDLGLIKTKAVPQSDGTYNITGTKIFISAGDHDLAENIIHLVLAKLPDAPAGSKGISCFIVPKFIVNDDGSLGDRNGVSVASLEHKMGIHGNATCVLNFDDAEGYLIGEENRGLDAMFTMMNSARLGVGIQGLGHGEMAYQHAAEYAKDRLQGRALTGAKNEGGVADPIIVHPNVRRMLMQMRSFVEGSRALAAYMGLQLDIAHSHPDEAVRQKAEDNTALLTPVVKAFLTDEGHVAANLAMQVYGGHGYIAEHGVEQHARDARIAQIYEGTNGIQALDLVGRKLPAKGGRAIISFLTDTKELIAECKEPALKQFTDPLAAALGSLEAATGWLMENGLANPDNAGAASVDYLRLLAVVAVGGMWLKMARISAQHLADSEAEDADFYRNKMKVGRFFMQRYVSEHTMLLARIQDGAEVMMSLAEDQF